MPFEFNNIIITEANIFAGLNPPFGTDLALYKSELGTPVMSDIAFEQVEYEDFAGNNIITPRIVFDSVIMTAVQTKNVITTTIQGRDGTVKEYIGMGDWAVTVHAVITSNINGKYPKDQMQDIYKLASAPVSIPITSWHLQQFAINYLTIESIDVSQEHGQYSQQLITFNCMSDLPIKFQLL